MKAYFSFWQGGWRGGFGEDQQLFYMQKISSYLAKKHFKEVHFLTDSKNSERFKQFNFNSIEVIFDNISKEYNSVWSINKLFAFKHICKKGDPFIHIDYDAFLWDDLPQRLRLADVFAQSKENNSYKWYELEKFLNHCPNPGLIGKVNPKPRDGINMGIFGGCNLEFINKYAQEALDIALNEQNKLFLYKTDVFENHWNKTCIIEQYTLPVCCQYYNIPCQFLFKYWPTEEQTKIQKYTHLLAAKNRSNIQEKVKLIASKLP